MHKLRKNLIITGLILLACILLQPQVMAEETAKAKKYTLKVSAVTFVIDDQAHYLKKGDAIPKGLTEDQLTKLEVAGYIKAATGGTGE